MVHETSSRALSPPCEAHKGETKRGLFIAAATKLTESFDSLLASVESEHDEDDFLRKPISRSQ